MPTPLAFPSSARLRKRGEFEQVRRGGAESTGRMMRLAAFRTGKKEETRIGIITSRRVGSAVVRTRVRRKLREICRLHRKLLVPGIWLVVIARSAAGRATYSDLDTEWMRLVQRLDIFKKQE